ncbi:MAG: purine-nucleoside phosphorylase [Firmicutes bacterium]|nr:purine-nucleoside phosphorylase [Bacillota bacterium]
MKEQKKKVEEAAKYVLSKIKIKPEVGMILGSGLGDLADEVQDAVSIPFGDIPNFPTSTVAGHAGKIVVGILEGRKVLAMKGRIHYYEGYTMKQVTFPIRLMKKLGINTLIVTNASGGINPSFKPGDLMIITDHINFQGANPLLGENDDEWGARFPDMTDAYTKTIVKLALDIAAKEGIPVQNGVFTAVAGPNYETVAEIKMLRTFGADAVGMSTVPEVLVARHAGMKILGISCVTDVIHTGEKTQSVSHEEVLAVANQAKPKFMKLMKAVLREIPA